MGGLFGSKPKSETRREPTLSPEQTQLQNELIEFFRANFLNGDDPVTPDEVPGFEGGFTADARPGQLNMENFLQNFDVGTPQAALDAFSQIAGGNFERSNIESGLGNFALGQAGTTSMPGRSERFAMDFTDFDEFFRRGVQDPALRQFNEEVLPGIASRTAPSNFFGSERLRAESDAISDLGQFLGEERGRLAFEDRGRQQQAAQFLDQLEAILGEGSAERQLRAALGLEESRLAEEGLGIQRGLASLEGADRLASAQGTEIANASNIIQALEPLRAAEQRGRELEFQDFRDRRQISEQDTLRQQEMLAMLDTLLGIPGIENIVTNTPGSAGILPSLIGAAGQVGAAALI